jgi:outer membrane protein assembly factor BamB
MNRPNRHLTTAILLVATALLVEVRIAQAQIIVGGGKIRIQAGNQGNPAEGDKDPNDSEPGENVFLLPDRNVLQQLTKARQLLKEERYGDAVRYLGAVLEGPEDFFFQPDKNVPIHRSLKAEAQRLIGQMPRQGWELYQLQFGARAQRMLTDAKSSGNADLLADVSRRFFHTTAGHEATFLLGLYQFDHARPLAAALTLERLREALPEAATFEPALSLTLASCWVQAGMPAKAKQTLLKLKEQCGGQPLEIAGRQVPLFTKDDDALGWLAHLIGLEHAGNHVEAERWPMFRGDPARNAQSAGSAPLLNLRWEVPVSDDPVVEDLLRQLHQVYVEQDVPVLPALHPLAVDDVVLMRTTRNLLALDFASGKRLWEVPVDDPLENLPGKSSPESLFRQSPSLAVGLGQRMWDDATYGTLSSDGRYVFSVEDLTLGMGNSVAARAGLIGLQAAQAPPVGLYNRLAAHDIRSGKLKWHIGGPPDQFALRQAETFFLGPPLPLMGQLYVLAESKPQGAILLLALDAESGDVLWSQTLAVVERDITEDPLRRYSGISPSYADGILVCPTSVGAVVAVDLATRSLLWGYRYGRNDLPSIGQPFAMMRANGAFPSVSLQYHWEDGAAAVANGRVLVTPVESGLLHCLNLVDGKLLWKYTRQDDLYVACIAGNEVVLVGRHSMHALQLADGKPAWDGRSVAFPEGSTPTGRGFCGGKEYFVPLNNAEVVAVDLAAGKITRTSKSRKGEVPGNLICHQGKVISQGFENLEMFYQLDAVREEVDHRLAAKPDDSGALALRGEILLDEGKQSEAIDCFRRAYRQDGDIRTKTLLRDALLDGLRLDFAQHRDAADEIERLLDDPIQRAAFHRLMATGLWQLHQAFAAFQQYLKLIDLDETHRPLDEVTPTLSVRRDRWIQGQLATLRNEVHDPAVLAEIDAAIEARLQTALASENTTLLRQFLDYFGNQPMAAAARRQWIHRLVANNRLLEAELALWPAEQSADPAVAGPALAELAEIFRKAGRAEDAAACYRRLANDYADVVCLQEKTGKQLADALPEDSAARRLLDSGSEWPVGAVEIKTVSARIPRQPSYARFDLRYEGASSPFFADASIRLDQHESAVFGYDGWGNERWRVSLESGLSNSFYFYGRSASRAAIHGHLLLMNVDTKLMAVDMLTNGGSTISGSQRPPTLWEHDLTAPGLDATFRQFQFAGALPVGVGVAPWGLQGVTSGRGNNKAGAFGPSTSHYACFQRFHNLIAIDPLNGEVLWTYRNLPPGCELFGDDELIFAVPRDQTEALAFRALDGQLLGKRPVPRFPPQESAGDGRRPLKFAPVGDTCLATLGRLALLWRKEDDQRLLELIDPWEGRDMWVPHKFAPGAAADVIGDEAVGVCEPNGHFVLLSLPAGRKIIDTRLKTNSGFASLSDVHLLKYGDQYLLLTHNPPHDGTESEHNIQPLPGTSSKLVTRGWIYAFDKQGEPLWPEPVLVQNQYFQTEQPSRVPMLTFVCQEYIRQENTARNQISVLCFDKRTGRKVYDGHLPSSTGTFDIVGNPQQHAVELRLQQSTIVLSFTDKPIPPPSATTSEIGDKQSGETKPNPIRTLWKAVEKMIGRQPASDADSVDEQELIVPVKER